MHYIVKHKFKGFLADNEEKGLYYSEDVNSDILKFDDFLEANLLCDKFESIFILNGNLVQSVVY